MLAPFNRILKRTLANAFTHPVDTTAHEQLRLRVLFAIAILKLLNFIGGAWDIQWHVEIGRDSLFIPPHLLVIAAFIGGLALVLAMIAYETSLALSIRRSRIRSAWVRCMPPGQCFQSWLVTRLPYFLACSMSSGIASLALMLPCGARLTC